MLPHSIFVAIIIKFVISTKLDQCRAQNVFSDLPISVNSQNNIYNDPRGTVHEVCGMTTVSSVNFTPTGFHIAIQKWIYYSKCNCISFEE